jgi:LmbE family N-acetylglucosaminyl deacetylase
MGHGFRQVWSGLVLIALATLSPAQTSAPDERYKADIVLVVAHPDDDTLVSSYLARAIFDQHKRVAVVFCTRGDSGANSEGREHARALGLVREIEAHRAMSVLGISNLWFLGGRDTATQNVLISLAAWPSAAVLEQIVRIFRLTRPEVVMTWLPSSVAGENHGDHQAAGVLATEGFDLAGDPAAFPAQVAAPIRQFENALEGLSPWQPKKLYYFTDAFETGFFEDRGPAYDGKEISPARKSPYIQLAAQSAAAYYTQSPDPRINRQIETGENLPEAITKLQQSGYLPESVRLWLGKALVPTTVTADVFDGIRPGAISFQPPKRPPLPVSLNLQVELAGPWGFYREFWRAHQLDSLRFLRPEIAVQPNDTLTIPLWVRNSNSQAAKLTPALILPPGWKPSGEIQPITIPADGLLTLALHAIAPAQPNDHFAELRISVTSGGTFVYQESVFVKVSPWVAGQAK